MRAALTADGPARYWLAFGIFAMALAVRLPLAVLAPVVSPDGETSLLVAQNMLQNACISISDPASAACIPHWGGNHLPGYPAFIALVRLLGGNAASLVTVIQTVLIALACARFVLALGRLVPVRNIVLGVGLIAALSPVQIAWARFLLPDALLVAATLWLFAELCLSVTENKMRMFPVGFALLSACLLRYDAALLAIPVMAIGFSLHSIKQTLARGMVIFLVVALPISALLIRNVSQGLSLVPRPGMMDGSQPPLGYFEWGNTWITTMTQGGLMAYGVWQFQYQRIEIDQDAYTSDVERQEVTTLLNQLHLHDGQPFPAEIDQAFAGIAARKRQQDPLHHYLVVPLKRMAVFWFYPNASFGWPLELGPLLSPDERRKIMHGTIMERLQIVALHPLAAMGKALVLAYRIVLVATGTLVFLLIVPTLRWPVQVIMWSALLYALLRTFVLSHQTSIDNRYMISAMAVLEMATAAGLGHWLHRRFRRSGRSEQNSPETL
jgi:hypothetical protein